MHKILISLFVTLLLIQGCSSWSDFSWVHVPDIQQGNIITPEMVADLELGQSKRQVLFVLGSPTLVDVFHQNRWDYTFTMKKRNEPIEIKQFSVYFKGDMLTGWQGDISPSENQEEVQDKKEIVVSVPDYKGDKGLFGWLFSDD
jgi:outer membrane protein assembly factor BamE